MKKKILILLSTSLPIVGYSDTDSPCESCPLLPPNPVESCELPAGYFYPAQYILGDCCAEISVGGEFIYWEVNFDALAQVGTRIQQAPPITNLDLLTHQQKYRPGFRVSLGIGFPQWDNWNFSAEYTWFHHTTTNRFKADINEVIVTRRLPQLFPIFSSALRSVQKLNLNFLRVAVGRPMYLSQRFIVTPVVGIKAWWCAQGEDLFFDVLFGLPQGTQFTKSHAWGIGPYFGAQIQALLWCGTYLMGKAGVWSAYTRLNKYRADTNFPAVPPVNFPGYVNVETNHNSPFDTQIMYEGGAGFGWGFYFCDCAYHIDFSACWELMTNFEQLQTFAGGLPIRQFYYQGFSIKAQFDF